jgi:hypothetical protein
MQLNCNNAKRAIQLALQKPWNIRFVRPCSGTVPINGYVIPIGCGSIFVIVGIVILLSYVPHCFRTDVDTTRLCCGGEMPRLWTIWMPLGLISFF